MNDAAAEHACLPVGRVVEHAGLPRRYAVLAGNEIDLDALRTTAEPGRPRRAGRAHAHEHLVPPDTQRLLDGALADPVHVAQPHAAGTQCFARTDDDAPRRRTPAPGRWCPRRSSSRRAAACGWYAVLRADRR